MSGIFQGAQIASNTITNDKLAEAIWLEIPIASSDDILSNDVAGLKATVTLERDGSDAVLKGKDGVELGRVNVSIGAISDAYYDSATNEIVIEVVTSGGTDELRIPAEDLIDIYTSSGYIDIDTDNNITLDYDLVKDTLLNDGFVNDLSAYSTTVQINDLLALKADKSDTYTKSEVDNSIQVAIDNADIDLEDYYTKTEADGKYVALTGAQSITGKKTFASITWTTAEAINLILSGSFITNEVVVSSIFKAGDFNSENIFPILANMTQSGNGTKFLSDNGVYLEVQTDGITQAQGDARYLRLTGGTITGQLLPASNGIYSIGSNTNMWNTVYAKQFTGENVTLPGGTVTTEAITATGNVSLTGNTTISRLNASTITSTNLNGVNVIATGTGANYLSDDGTYKPLNTTGLEARISALEVELLGASQALSALEVNSI